MSTIEVTNSGPIEGTFSIDLSHGPGAYEFRGRRGTGKTTLISSIDWLAGHKIDVTLHDGAIAGKVAGFGVVAPIGGRKRRKGEMELDTIDAEKFSLGDLIDPPGKTPDVRDKQRIKAIAVLSGTTAEPKLYHELAGGKSGFAALGIATTVDPVLLATRIKDVFDKQAREAQRTAEAEARHAEPLEHVPDDLDISQSCDLESLGQTRDDVRDTLQKVRSEREHGLRRESQIRAAAERLEAIEADYDGPSVEDAEAAGFKAKKALEDATVSVAKLKQQLADAQKDAAVCENQYQSAKATYSAAKSHEAAVSELRQTASETVTYPTEEEIVSLETAVQVATESYDQGVRLRDVLRNREQAKAHRRAAEAAEKESIEAKNKAGQVFDVLAHSLTTEHLQIQPVDGNPRLFVTHPRRGRCAFDQVNGLSDGERVDYALRELLPHIDSPGLLPIPQRVWQDLQPSDRKSLHELAVAKNLYLFGAQVDDGELRVQWLGEEDEHATP